ncbi:MAG TPA: hypothetical protein VMY76_14600 [Gemmatimonadales bacterium]|nr:hypothetical protein [Gemmatimonadales bacterium]
MNRGKIQEVIAQAVTAREAVAATRGRSAEERESWRAWWAELGRQPIESRMLAVCMSCERFRATSGSWELLPPGVGALLPLHGSTQITLGICSECLARGLGEVHAVLPQAAG